MEVEAKIGCQGWSPHFFASTALAMRHAFSSDSIPSSLNVYHLEMFGMDAGVGLRSFTRYVLPCSNNGWTTRFLRSP